MHGLRRGLQHLGSLLCESACCGTSIHVSCMHSKVRLVQRIMVLYACAACQSSSLTQRSIAPPRG